MGTPYVYHCKVNDCGQPALRHDHRSPTHHSPSYFWIGTPSCPLNSFLVSWRRRIAAVGTFTFLPWVHIPICNTSWLASYRFSWARLCLGRSGSNHYRVWKAFWKVLLELVHGLYYLICSVVGMMLKGYWYSWQARVIFRKPRLLDWSP